MDLHACSGTELFITSKLEMNRRKRAFVSLLSSLYITVSILSIKTIVELPGFLLPVLAISAFVIALLIVTVNKMLDKQSCLSICLSDNELEWNRKDSKNALPLTEVESIRIKGQRED